MSLVAIFYTKQIEIFKLINCYAFLDTYIACGTHTQCIFNFFLIFLLEKILYLQGKREWQAGHLRIALKLLNYDLFVHTACMACISTICPALW